VRKHSAGYYLVLHPIAPSTGRPDFMGWMLDKQREAMGGLATTASPLVTAPSSLLLLPEPPASSATAAARRHHNAMALRQMSKDLAAIAPLRQGSRAAAVTAKSMVPVPQASGLSGRQASGDGPQNSLEEQMKDPLEGAMLSKVRF
jgi:hypothetical protein